MKNRLKNEPVVLAAAIPVLVGAVLILLVSFGVPVTPEQADAIVQVITLAIPVAMAIGAVIARGRVSPTKDDDNSHNTHVLREGEGTDESV